MKSGFTLVEVIIVLAILSLTIAAAGLALRPPSTGTFAADELAGYLRAARSRALDQGVSAHIEVWRDGSIVAAFANDSGNAPARYRLESCVSPLTRGRSVSFTITAHGLLYGDSISFECDGFKSHLAPKGLTGEVTVAK